ncbi:MAG: DUF2125 domain-containing protein [Asticcacaulis sp.]
MTDAITDIAKPKKKPSRWGLFGPVIVLLIVVAGWSGYWFYVAHQIESRMTVQRQLLISNGYHVAWSPLHVKGWPFRMFVELKDVQLVAPNGKGLAMAKLEAEASAFALDKWMFVAKDDLTLYRGRLATTTGTIDLGEVKVTGEALRASVSGWTQPLQTIGLEGLNTTFTPSKPEFPFALQSAQRLEARVVPAKGAVDTVDFIWRTSGAQGHPQSLLGRLGQGGSFDLALQGQMAQASKFRGDFNDWRLAGGSVRQVQASLHVGGLEVFSRSDALTLSPDLSLNGPLSVEIKGSGDPFGFLLGAGLIAPEYEPLARPFVGTTLTADKPVKLDFVFRDGGAYVGPLRVSNAPVVR